MSGLSLIKKMSLLGLIFLVGCAPLYKVQPGTPHTTLNTTTMPSPHMCLNGQTYSLSTDSSGNTQIPTGINITLMSKFVSSDGSIMWSCQPRLGFMPEENINYVGTVHLKGRQCALQIFRENPETPSGLAWDKTVWRGTCPN